MTAILAGGRADEESTFEFALEAARGRKLELEELKAEWAEWDKNSR